VFSNAAWQLEELDIESAWESFERKYNSATKLCIPTTNSVPSRWKKPLWMDKETSRAVKRKHWAWKRYRLTGSRQDYDNYAKRRKAVQSTSTRARRNLEKKIAMEAKVKPKSFWAYVKKQTKASQGLHPLVKADGTMTTRDKEKAELWSDFFASVFTSEELSNIPLMDEKPFVAPLDRIYINEEEVEKELKNLKVDKSPGPDAIHPKVLHECVNAIKAPLTKIFQKSLDEGRVPTSWKLANITPIYKKGEKSDAQNYRPVSLTSVTCKILERLIRKRVMTFLQDNQLLADQQYGFRPHRSTTTQLLQAMDEWTEWLDNGKNFDVMYMDFAKAFDSVPHQRLLVKVKAYGIRGNLLEWIEDFLKGRRQRVIVNSAASAWEGVRSGIPQGSVMGPVLFVLFINDLPDQLESRVLMYADDTKIYAKVNNEAEQNRLQDDLANVLRWAEKWQLRFNLEKCKVMHYGRSNQNYSYNMCEQPLMRMQVTEEEKDLGILFTKDLKFSEHTAKAAKKANQMVGMVKRSFKYMDKVSFSQIYKALIRSHLETGNRVWCPILKTDADHLEKVQRRATKLVPEIRDLPYGERLKSLNLHSLLYRRRRGDMIQVYKIVHKLEDMGERNIIQLAAGRTRGHSYKLEKPRCNQRLRQHAFGHRVINDWNHLPEEVVNAPSLDSFKGRLDSHWSHLHYIF